jgi:hypothetical protein
MSSISPPLHWLQHWKHPLPSALLSAHSLLHQHHLSSHQGRAITGRLCNRLAFESTSSTRWHRCCCQPDSSSSHPNLPRTLWLRWNCRENRWRNKMVCGIDMMCLFFKLCCTSPIMYTAPMLLSIRQQLHPPEPRPHTSIALRSQETVREGRKVFLSWTYLTHSPTRLRCCCQCNSSSTHQNLPCQFWFY